ncbi:thiosulfate dehydrogenase [quinone] large subunit [Bacillus mesophilus]|uniref:DoxX family protein n=1 Tax=Bacillus mesophilus TaxID=1808955 RepID=A0A6M0Q3T9_9BACI|nr:DoxX family protein [Bacillus mesophilus]MBM7660326.1 thiosulfate dehydrogenase [quinone] large subunit [Bacillus mesophilus]NEY71037.1 DoxX family protein [Bacillus mesophilus]
MIVNFIRTHKISAYILTALRLFLGFAWMTTGWRKLTGGGFDATGYLKGAIANPVAGPDGIVYGWYVAFLENVALPNVAVFNVLVPLGEFLVGLGLILGCFTTAAAFFGVVMNFAFMLAGTVSQNPTDILMGFIIMVAGYNAGRYGLDRWVLPLIKKIIVRNDNKPNNPNKDEVNNKPVAA